MRSKETQQLVERMLRFNKLMHHRMAHASDCSAGEGKMLSVIGREQEWNEQEGNGLPGVTVSRISERMMHSKPATSKMLRILEEKGEIARIASKKDRRTVYIALTELGKQREQKLQEQLDHFNNQIFERLGEERSTQLFEIMDEVYDIIHEIQMEEFAKTKIKKEK